MDFHAIRPFKLERYFAKYEFKVRHLLSPSDCEALSMSELLDLCDPATRKLWDSLRLGYTESAGNPLLREEISQLYSHLNPDQILVAAPQEAILLVMQAALKPADHVISIFPAYQSLYEIAHSMGVDVSYWRIKESQLGWTLDFDDLEMMLRPNSRLLILNFPHNPSGYQPSLEEYLKIIAFARNHNLLLFCDEMYRFLEYPPAAPLPPAADIYEKAISLSGLSKSFALPGLRIGWIATQFKEIFDRCAILKDYTTICSSAPSEILAIIALRNRSFILQRNLQILSENIQFAAAFFERYSNLFKWVAPKAGSVALARWLGKTHFINVCQDLLEQKGLMVLPGTVFEIEDDYFRLGLGRKTFQSALEQFADWIQSHGEVLND